MNETDTGPNHELFVKVLAQIEKHPETWNQNTFLCNSRNPVPSVSNCGTGMCFAGWAVAMVERSNEWAVDGKIVPERALDHLGIGDSAIGGAHAIFAPHNTLDVLYEMSAEILGLDETVLRDKVAAEVSS